MSKEESLYPEFLAEESEFMDRTAAKASKYLPRLELSDYGSLVRILPAQFGPKKTFYVRSAKHWFGKGKSPITCKTLTAPEFGGDSEAECPICRLAEKYADHADEEINKKAFRSKANPSWQVCLLLVAEDDGRDIIKNKKNPRAVYQFEFNQSAFADLLGIYRKELRNLGPNSFLDLHEGVDLWLLPKLNKVGKRCGLTLQLERNSRAIPGIDDEQVYAEIFDQIKQPKFKFPSEDELEDEAEKLKDYFLGSSGRGRRDEEAPTSRRSRVDDDADESPSPRRRPAPIDEEEEEVSPRARRAPVDEDEPAPRRRPSVPADDEEEEEVVAKAAPRRREVELEADEAPARPSSGSRALPPPPASKRALPPSAAPDDDDEIPMESNDPAPASELPIDEDEDEAPPVVRTPGQTNALSNKILQSIKRSKV